MKKYLTLLLITLVLQSSGWSQTLNTGRVTGPLKKEAASVQQLPENILIKSVATPEIRQVPHQEFSRIRKVSSAGTGYRIERTNEKALDSVVFMRPEGYFFPSLTPDYSYYSYYFLFGPAYSTGHWRNFSGGATSYSWTLPDPNGEVDISTDAVVQTIHSTATHPEANYPYNVYYSTPSLTASDGTNSLTYRHGGIDSTYLFTGGSSLIFLETGICNYNTHENMYVYNDGPGNYIFGTSTANDDVDAIVNIFEKPTHTYVLDSIWISAIYCTAPAGTEFRIIIHKIDDEGNLTDTLGTATTTIENVAGPYGNNVAYTLLFGEFQVYDPDLGFELTQDYLEIDDAIAIELNGFNHNNNITFSVLAQEFDSSPTRENNAYVFYYEGEERNFGSYGGSTSLSFNLGIFYSYLFADKSTFRVSADGGSRLFDVTIYFNPDNAMWVEDELPDWLSLAYTFDPAIWKTTLKITAEALPAALSERRDSITIATIGSKFTFDIHQSELFDDSDEDNLSDIKDISGGNIYLTQRNGEIFVSYPVVYNELDIIDLSGRIVEKHSLPVTGEYTFRPAFGSKGTIYLYRLSGRNMPPQTFRLLY